MLPKKNKKREESAAAHWCFKVCSPCFTVWVADFEAPAGRNAFYSFLWQIGQKKQK
jgi:hypothetical protein